MMNPTSLDLRSISCKGIRSFNLFQKPSTFALVSLIDPSDPDRDQEEPKKKTAVDSDGGESPEWAESFRFDLDGRRDLTLGIDIMVQGNIPLLLGERVVGTARIPIADLLDGGRDGSVRHVSYRVVGTDGTPNGVVSFSYHLNYPPPAVSLPPGDYYPVPDPVASGYHPPPRQQYPVISSMAGDWCPPPRQEEHVVAYPPPAAVGGYYLPSEVHVAYPPPLAPPTECCYPPPQQAYCYPPPTRRDGYDCCPERWDRGLY